MKLIFPNTYGFTNCVLTILLHQPLRYQSMSLFINDVFQFNANIFAIILLFNILHQYGPTYRWKGGRNVRSL